MTIEEIGLTMNRGVSSVRTDSNCRGITLGKFSEKAIEPFANGEPIPAEGDQFVLPVCSGDDRFRLHRDVILSIHPQYSSKIMSGEKTVELRRRFPVSTPKGIVAYIYSTAPVQATIGSARIKDVMNLSVDEIWQRFSEQALIKKADFDSYFEGSDVGCALLFEEVKPFSKPLPLEFLRERFAFEPPQSFLYAKHELRNALEQE